MLEEAIEVMRLLWQGDLQSHRGQHYTVEHARIYTLPDEAPPVLVAASGAQMAKLAGRIGDGLISVGPEPKVREQFEAAGGAGKPCYGQLHVCWAATDAEARRTAHEWWPTAALPGELNAELSLPRQFEAAATLVREEDVAQAIVCSADPERHLQAIKELVEAGYDHVYVHQVGPDQDGFFRFYEQQVLPRLG
jgi:coenzyme F420-dependent glucose-6-phosphate dehydrogenase